MDDTPQLPPELTVTIGTGAYSTLPLSLLLALVDVIEARETYIRSRARNVATYAAATARVMGLPADAIDALRLAALLSNIGMLRVPEVILQKTTQLTQEEREKVRHHPVYSAEILSGAPELRAIVPVVLHHHEDFGGGGYPGGISGQRIPLGARIIRLCDTYDALTCERPYRPAYPLAEAITVLSAGAGRQFDSSVVEAFARGMQQPPRHDEALDRWDDVQSDTTAWRVLNADTTGLLRQ